MVDKCFKIDHLYQDYESEIPELAQLGANFFILLKYMFKWSTNGFCFGSDPKLKNPKKPKTKTRTNFFLHSFIQTNNLNFRLIF